MKKCILDPSPTPVELLQLTADETAVELLQLTLDEREVKLIHPAFPIFLIHRIVSNKMLFFEDTKFWNGL